MPYLIVELKYLFMVVVRPRKKDCGDDEKKSILCLRLIFEEISNKKCGCPGGAFERFGCPKRHPDALLSKSMLVCVFLERPGVQSDWLNNR